MALVGDTKAESLENKQAAGSFASGIDGGVSKQLAELGTLMVTEASWIDYAICSKKLQEQLGLAPKAEEAGNKVDPLVSLITKEKVPDTFIDVLKKRRVMKKLPPITERPSASLFARFPEIRDAFLVEYTDRNCCVDLHVDVLRQHADKGFAEVGVVYTDGVKRIFVLPQLLPSPSPRYDGEGAGGGVRSKTKLLVFVSGLAILFALLVVLLSCAFLL